MALTRVIMPKTGAEMEEGRIVAWKKKEGDTIAKGEVLLDIETDKATMEVEAPAAGLLLKRLYGEGDVAPATSLIAVLGDGDEPAGDVERLIAEASGIAIVPVMTATVAQATLPASRPAAAPSNVKASPLARRLAQEKGIELASIQGSGPGGRIEKDDVMRTAEVKAKAPAAPAVIAGGSGIPLSPMRRAVARRVERSKREMADFSVTMLMDMTAVLRKKADLQAAGTRVSINDLLVLAVARTLVSHPDLNAELQGDLLCRHSDINVGVAAGTDDGLYVPVVRNANRLSAEQIAAETARYTSKIEKKQITEQDMTGGTFTISNLGMFGVESFTAIIVPPQTGILSVGALTERPVRGASGQLEWQPILAATLTVDHRVVDGLAAAKFLRDLKSNLAAL